MKVKADELKEGDLIWWTAERYCKDWDCPAIYRGTQEDGRHRIESLDDGAITAIVKETLERECSISNAFNHKAWFQKKIHSIDGVILELNQKIGLQEIKKDEIRIRMDSYL